MGQNLRFALLFLLSLNRLIIEKYGGKTMSEKSEVSPNCPATRQGNFTLLKTSSNFCYDYERDWGWHPCEGFGWERPNFWYIVNLLVCLFLFFFAIRSDLPLILFVFKFVIVQKPGGHMQQNPLQKRDKKS